MSQPRALYLHIPFCLSKCAYCDFASRPVTGRAEMARYVRALRSEIRRRACGRVSSLYFGGGTPSLLEPGQVQRLLADIGARAEIHADAEISLEANPATAGRAKLAGFLRAGVNRLSVGVQSTADQNLVRLGRRHDSEAAAGFVREARRAGWKNLSCDLIYGLPGQTLREFQTDLARLLSWEPDHVSLYALGLEPGTPLAERVAAADLPRPDDDLAADMYSWGRDRLAAGGYAQYELSNFARPGKACRHNLHYWRGGEYLGLGAAAHSYYRGVRSWNDADPDAYRISLEKGFLPVAGRESLDPRSRLGEALIVGLRLTAGVRRLPLEANFGREALASLEPAFRRFQQEGLLEKDRDAIRLTPRGMLLANVVFRALV